jgi:site-specific recombinase XerC
MNHTTSSTTRNEYGSPDPGTTNRNAKAVGRANKRRQPSRQSIKPEDLKSLLDAITNSRDKALLLILVESGLRIGEITRLDRSAIRVVASTSADGPEISLGTGTVLLSKGGSCRTFWVGPDSVTAVAEYLTKDRAADDEPALFVTKQGKRVTTAEISATVAGWCNRVGIEPITCRRFRYTLALNLV